MRIPRSVVWCVAALLPYATSLFAGDDGGFSARGIGAIESEDGPSRRELIDRFLAAHPGTRVYETETGRVRHVYGNAFGHGDTARDSAESFRADLAGIWGVDPDDLIPVGRFRDGRHVQPIMYEHEAGTYKFTGFFYTQTVDGVPVFRGELILLVRNVDTYPLVLATATLRNVGAFQVEVDATALPHELLRNRAAELLGAGTTVSDVELVVYADREDEAPTLGTRFIASNRSATRPRKSLFVVDPMGNVLFEESQISHIDIVGNVSGLITQNHGADVCEPEALRPLPYVEALVLAGNSTFADARGDFTIPHGGDAPVFVRAQLSGRWFEVLRPGGQTPILQQVITPPGPADFIFNEANLSELERAEVNAYVHANVVRDFALFYNPSYPIIATEESFDVNVNIDSNCDAFYDGNSINFVTSGGGCNNSAFAPVVYHEYGHHLVAAAGAGQGQYGEGMGDVMALLITGEPVLALGFSSCRDGLRSAENTVQYPCAGSSQDCGRLLSGCVWDTWQALGGPGSAGDHVIANLAINAMVLRGLEQPGEPMIDPGITINFLTLDDDNGNISDGTPHYHEIAAGFGMHNMDAPPLSCPADLSGNGRVGFEDLLILLGAWGSFGGDVNGDGTTDVQDLLQLIIAWGPCP